MEMVIIPKNELHDLLKGIVDEALNVRPVQEQKSVKTSDQEGDIDFALSITKEKAGISSKSTIWKWSHEGRIPCSKRGKKLWFTRKDLEAWIDAGMPHVGQKKAANKLADSAR